MPGEPKPKPVSAASVNVGNIDGEANITVTEWWSGEGFDVRVQRESEPLQVFELTWFEWQGLKKTVKSLSQPPSDT